MNIQVLIKEFIRDGGPATLTTQNGESGVTFTDENEFIPFGNLGYNRELGFYKISLFPDEHNEGGINFSTVSFLDNDGDGQYREWAILVDDLTDGFVIGEWGEVTQLYAALKRLVETGQADEETHHLDERLGIVWLSVSEAAEFANSRLSTVISERAIRYACERDEIFKAEKKGKEWRFPQPIFLNWMRNRPKPGPKKGQRMSDLPEPKILAGPFETRIEAEAVLTDDFAPDVPNPHIVHKPDDNKYYICDVREMMAEAHLRDPSMGTHSTNA